MHACIHACIHQTSLSTRPSPRSPHPSLQPMYQTQHSHQTHPRSLSTRPSPIRAHLTALFSSAPSFSPPLLPKKHTPPTTSKQPYHKPPQKTTLPQGKGTLPNHPITITTPPNHPNHPTIKSPPPNHPIKNSQKFSPPPKPPIQSPPSTTLVANI